MDSCLSNGDRQRESDDKSKENKTSTKTKPNATPPQNNNIHNVLAVIISIGDYELDDHQNADVQDGDLKSIPAHKDVKNLT